MSPRYPSSLKFATPDGVIIGAGFDGVNWTPVSKNAAGSGNLLQVAHCLMVIILPCPKDGSGRGWQIPRWASPWIRRLRPERRDATTPESDSTDGITNITSTF